MLQKTLGIILKNKVISTTLDCIKLKKRGFAKTDENEYLPTLDEVLEAEVQLLRSSYQNKETNLDGILSKYATFFSRRDVWRPLIITFGLFLLQGRP